LRETEKREAEVGRPATAARAAAVMEAREGVELTAEATEAPVTRGVTEPTADRAETALEDWEAAAEPERLVEVEA
jgi:hypothetical protein